MDPDLILGLIHNIALLLAISLLVGFYWKKEAFRVNLRDKLFAGLFLGAIGVVIMMTPWVLSPGLVFDTRSVLISVSGLFFGFIPTLLAMIMTVAYRIYLGGDGVYMGIAVIVSAGSLGLLWRKFRPDWQVKNPALELYALGLLVHLVMLVCTLLLPTEKFLSTLETITLPVMVIYPVGTLLFGLLMLNRVRHWQTKRDLKQSEEKFRQLFERSDTTMLLIDPQSGSIADANPSASRYYGYSIADLKSKHLWDLSMLTSGEVLAALRSGFGDEKHGYEFKHLLAGGVVREVEVHSSPIEYLGKTHLFSIIHDITERKKTEAALVSAKERAEQSDRLKSTFLATMSHELRTPLNAIIGFSDLMAETPDLPDVARFSKTIHTSGIHLLSIIESIFDIALLQSKESQVVHSKVPLSDLFQEVDQLLSVEKKRRSKLHLQTRFRPDPAYNEVVIRSDKVKLIQLLSNLINNALKFTSEGLIEYGYTVSRNDVTFFVKDTGVGIPEEKTELIFQMFRQGEENHTRVQGGVGLGLAICREIATLLKGRIWVESRVGIGSVFYFELKEAIGLEGLHEGTGSAGKETADFSGHTILIVDDMEENLFLLKRLIVSTGATALVAESGESAIGRVRSNPEIDLVLMDVKMPEMNGFEATRIIHSIRPDLPVAAQTAYVLQGDREAAMEAGCSGFIAKPIDKESLFSLMKRTIPAKQSKDPGHDTHH
jgi:PAS domain S-box-containing protein